MSDIQWCPNLYSLPGSNWILHPSILPPTFQCDLRWPCFFYKLWRLLHFGRKVRKAGQEAVHGNRETDLRVRAGNAKAFEPLSTHLGTLLILPTTSPASSLSICSVHVEPVILSNPISASCWVAWWHGSFFCVSCENNCHVCLSNCHSSQVWLG